MEHWQRGHVHPYVGPTEVALEHIHQVVGTTGPSDSRYGRPYSPYRGISTTDREHSHGYSIYTGPPIPLCGGQHVHQADGMTTVNEEHEHGVQLETGTPEPCTCQGNMYDYGMEGMGESW